MSMPPSGLCDEMYGATGATVNKSGDRPRLLIEPWGTAANGGIPQHECFCPTCRAAWEDPKLRRNMTTFRVSSSLDRYYKIVFFDSGPDLRHQMMEANAAPYRATSETGWRETRTDCTFLTHGHYDHTGGLGLYSTGRAFKRPVYAPSDLIDAMFGTKENPGWYAKLGRLDEDYVKPVPLKDGDVKTVLDGSLRVEAFEVPHTDRVGEDSYHPSRTFGYDATFLPSGKRFVFTPDIKELTEEAIRHIEGADLYVMDGTFWSEDELERTTSGKVNFTSTQLGHVPIGEGARKPAGLCGLQPQGWAKKFRSGLEVLDQVAVGHVLFDHFNHSNPAVDPETSGRCQGKLDEINRKYKKPKFSFAKDYVKIYL
jgi:pyrroloquinoline quinone biosynthesis protein B